MSTQTSSLEPQAAPVNLTPAPSGILQRKCACGDHTVAGGECAECGKNKTGLQRKLTIGFSNDPLEQEADRVADQVMAAPVHSAVSTGPPRIQRFTAEAREGADTAPASVDHVLASSGRPMELALRQDMEQRFGHDFSRVRVHSGAAAEQSARDVNANAYTVGHNIVFGAGQFAPASHRGRRLLAHELTHVVQQGTETEAQSAPVADRAFTVTAAEREEPIATALFIKTRIAPQLGGMPGPARESRAAVPAAAGTLIHKALLAFFMMTVPGAVRIYIPGGAANPQRTGDKRTIKPEQNRRCESECRQRHSRLGGTQCPGHSAGCGAQASEY
jgi:hypothetical protein